MRPVFLACFALVPLLFSSCATCWRGGIPMRDTEEKSQWGAEVDILQSAKTANVVIYRGLAHPKTEAGLYSKQVKAGGWVEFQGFKFFQQPATDLPPDTAQKVLKLYCKSDSHQALALKNVCPGFHPDYALVWSSGGKQRVLQICYGCHEWKYFGPGGTVHTDINEPAFFDTLIKLLPPKHKLSE